MRAYVARFHPSVAGSLHRSIGMRVRPSYYLSLARTRRSVAMLICVALFGAACSSKSETTTSPTAGGRCGMTLAASPSTVDANGGTGQVNITVERDCTWDARADADWIRLTPPTSGQGQGTLRFTTTANTATSSRRGAVIVNDQRVDVVQAAAACSFALSAPGAEAPAAGVSLAVTVTAPTGCSWTATSQVEWIQISQGRQGSGNGVVSIAVAAN